MSTAVDTPTNCIRCGQKLLLLAPGREVCERCRMGRSRLPGPANVASAPVEEKPAVPCAGCGRTTTDIGGPLPLADGYCLSCRVQGRHR